MRGLIGLVLISTSASLYNKDKIYNQLGLENGTKYNLNVIDLDKKNFKYRNYFANTTDIFKKSKSPDMVRPSFQLYSFFFNIFLLFTHFLFFILDFL